MKEKAYIINKRFIKAATNKLIHMRLNLLYIFAFGLKGLSINGGDF